MAGFSGLRASNDYSSDNTPENWRELIMRQYPNGKALLTGFTTHLKKEETNFPTFNWLTKAFQAKEVAVTGIYTDAILDTALNAGNSAAGTILNVKMAEDATTHFRPGHQILLRDANYPLVDINARVIAVNPNGVSSFLQVSLLEADDAVGDGATYGLLSCDVAQLVGDVNPEAGEMPEAISYEPVDQFNYTQIVRTPVKMSRTAMKSKFRFGEAYKEAKMDALEDHGEALERIFLFGVRSAGIGSNNLPMKTTGGMIPYIRDNASANVADFRYDTTTAYSGKSWTEKGKDFLMNQLKLAFENGDGQKACYAGSGALLGFNYLAEIYSHLNVVPGQTKWGMRYNTVICPWGELEIVQHPLLSASSVNNSTLLIFDTSLMKYRYLSDTFFKKSIPLEQATHAAIDGIEEEWITEAGLEMSFANECAVLYGVGETNVV